LRGGVTCGVEGTERKGEGRSTRGRRRCRQRGCTPCASVSGPQDAGLQRHGLGSEGDGAWGPGVVKKGACEMNNTKITDAKIRPARTQTTQHKESGTGIELGPDRGPGGQRCRFGRCRLRAVGDASDDDGGGLEDDGRGGLRQEAVERLASDNEAISALWDVSKGGRIIWLGTYRK
jgi:hypothetical protein